jgi:hypothetical protein
LFGDQHPLTACWKMSVSGRFQAGVDENLVACISSAGTDHVRKAHDSFSLKRSIHSYVLHTHSYNVPLGALLLLSVDNNG